MKKVMISIICLLSVIIFNACKEPPVDEELTEAQKYYNNNFANKSFYMTSVDENGEPEIDEYTNKYKKYGGENISGRLYFDAVSLSTCPTGTVEFCIQGHIFYIQITEFEVSNGKLKICLETTSEVFEPYEFGSGGTAYFEGPAYIEILSDNEDYMLIKISCSWHFESDESDKYAGIYIYEYPKQSSPENNNDTDEDNNGNDDVSLYNGTYSFTNATAPQMNGSITLNNGNWSYSGDKTSPAASNGTYTVSNNKLTMKWTASGYEVSESFTISNNGSVSTWKSENSATSTLFSMLFGVVSLNMDFTKS